MAQDGQMSPDQCTFDMGGSTMSLKALVRVLYMLGAHEQVTIRNCASTAETIVVLEKLK